MTYPSNNLSWFSRTARARPGEVLPADYGELVRLPIDQLSTRTDPTDQELAGQLLAYVLSAAWRSTSAARISSGDVLYVRDVAGTRSYLVGTPRVPHDLAHACTGGARTVDVFDAYTLAPCPMEMT